MSTRLETAGDILRGAVAGMIGGAVASWVMNRAMAAQQQTQQQAENAAGGGEGKSSGPRRQQQTQQQAQQQEGDDAAVKTAQAISRGLFDHELKPAEKKIAGPLVHYGYGTMVGGLYGALAEVWPTVSAGFGMAYGVVLWALGDEVAVPALRLGPPPTQVPAEKHADYLAGHVLYGITLDVARRMARHVV